MTTDPFEMGKGDYVPDPERDTTILVDAFFDHVAERAAWVGPGWRRARLTRRLSV